MRWYLPLIFFIPAFASAEDYYWKIRDASWPQQYSSPVSACQAYAQRTYGAGGYYEYRSVTRVNDTSFLCYLRAFNADGSIAVSNQLAGYVDRFGTTCPANTTYDTQTGECKGDPCQPTIGQVAIHRHRAGEFTGMGEIGARVDPPGSVCRQQCQYAFNFKPVRSYRFDNGDPAGVFIGYEYVGNGVSCVGSEPQFAEPSDGMPTAESQSECTNKVVHADGSQSYDCQATELNIEPGNMDCYVGEVGGVLDCVGKKPTPSLTETKVDQEIVEKPNADGSTTTTTTTETTVTKCVGTNACTTSTTTNVNNSKTNADGTSGGESSTCKGAGCKGEGESEEESEESEREATVGECQAPIACSGDAIDCAVLQQQKEQRCLAEEMADFEGNESDIEAMFEGEKFDLDEGEGDIEVPSFIQQGTRFLPATCPQDKSFNLSTAGGRTFALSFEPLCQAASDLSGLFVAVATIFAALYVGRAVGGQ